MKQIILFISIVTGLLSYDATIDITKKVNSLPSIAIEDSSIFKKNNISQKLYRVFINDLKIVSGLDVVDEYRITAYNSSGHFKNNKINYILKYRISQNKSKYIVDIKLINNATDSSVFKKRYEIKSLNYYIFLGHTVISDLNNFFGFSSVEWMKKYVIFARYTAPRVSEIVLADYSLSYQQVIIKGGTNIFPKWENSKQKSFYFTRIMDKPTLFKFSLKTGKIRKIITSDGMLVCSDVSKDGKKLLLTMAPSGQSDIYLYNVDTKKAKQITSFTGIDVNGKFINNEKSISFVSSRLGYPNIFSKDLHSRSIKQLVFKGRNNSSCDTSENYLVYSSRETNNAFSPNTFNLYLISTLTDYVRKLSVSGINQYPRFSYDGQTIMFIKHYNNKSSLGLIRLNYNKSFLFPLNVGKLQSIDW